MEVKCEDASAFVKLVLICAFAGRDRRRVDWETLAV
jgi:hypothetical protein